jgi:hypothetical protein
MVTRVVATEKEETLVDLLEMIAEVAMEAMAMKNALRSVREVVWVVVARKPTCAAVATWTTAWLVYVAKSAGMMAKKVC